MNRVPESCEAEIEVKRSRFIALLVPYVDFSGLQERLKREHPKASHVVYATRHINEYGQIVENSSDDGEPRGCAGQPVLNALRGAELVESALLVVRYFGGIKLGTGGMVRAYGAAAREVIEAARLEPWRPLGRLRFISGYNAQRQIHYLLERLGIPPGTCRYEGEGVHWELKAPNEDLERFRQEAGRLIRISEEAGD